MKTTETKISPLRQRMIEDMTMRKFKKHTQTDYIRAVKKLAKFINKPLTCATKEDMRRLIDVATPKYQAAFSIAYGAGLRISEIVTLTTNNINSERRESLSG